MRITSLLPRARAGESSAARRFPRWVLLPVALVLLAALVFWWLQRQPVAPAFSGTATVGQGDLTLSVTGSGAIQPARQIDLPFQQAGTITSVDVKVGDQVKAGQVLARIDDTDLKLQVQQAQASLKAAEAQLAQAKGGSATPQDLATAKAQLESAKAKLSQTRTGTATKADIASAQAQLESAKAKLAALRNPDASARTTAQSKVEQAQTSLQTTRDSASQTKTNAELALRNAVNALTQAQSKYATAKGNWEHVQESGTDPVQPSKTGSDGKSVPNTLTDGQRQQYYDAYVQAQAALSNAENAVAQAQVAYDTARQREVNDVAQAEASVRDAQQQYQALFSPSASDVAQAQAAVTQAQANLDKLRAGGTAAEITQAQASVTQAQANLEKLTAPGTEATLASAEANLLQAQANLDQAQRNLDHALLKAPFDGVVASVSASVGAIASSSASAVTLVDRSKLYVNLSLTESDAAKVQVGQPVALTFDALPNIRVNGTVRTVAPAATVQQNVVTYPVQVEFDPGTAPLKVGMSTSAEIQIQQISNAILVPSRAVQTVGGSRMVTVLQGDRRVPVPVLVTVGANSNGQTQITGCVETGDQCLRTGDIVALPATTTTNRSGTFGGGPGGFPVPGGGGARPRGDAVIIAP
jgi:HlyD family secretion protein